jgi:protein-disulfide isomerase
MKVRICSLIILFAVTLLPLAGRAAEPADCAKLPPGLKTAAQNLFVNLYPYDCCDDKMSVCLEHTPVCPLVTRLANEVCRKLAQGKSSSDIERTFANRARSMMRSARKYQIDLTDYPAYGDANAPVTLVEYACISCPFCGKITPQIMHEIKSGRLKGKVKLYFKPFPVRSHRGSKEGSLAFIAAREMKKYYEYIVLAYKNYSNDQEVSEIYDWARQIGLSPEKFRTLATSSEMEYLLIDSKREGLMNKVHATPTFFINNRFYYAELEIDYIVELLEEEYERVTGTER